MNAKEVVEKAGGKWQGKYGMIRCPAHDDKNPSCMVSDGENEVIVNCLAGCDWRDVKEALRAKGCLDELERVRGKQEDIPSDAGTVRRRRRYGFLSRVGT